MSIEQKIKLLTEAGKMERFCKACERRRYSTAIYTCSECHFSLDVTCSLLKRSEHGPACEPIQHLVLDEGTPQHPHPLIPCNPIPDFGPTCFCCLLPFGNDTIWICLECHRLVHKSCIQFINGFRSPFHPQHLLSPYCDPTTGQLCHACGFPGVNFRCEEYFCDYKLHSSCASCLSPTDQPHDSPIHHLGQNNHSLFRCRMTRNCGGLPCSACWLPFDSSMTTIYACPQCQVLLHQSCLEWPLQIKHPFHPQHSLCLASKPPEYDFDICVWEVPCSACGKSMYGCNYHCSSPDCHFFLHIRCASLLRPIATKRHEHLLLLRNDYSSYKTCYACHGTIHKFYSYLRCVQCNLDLHLRCYPIVLPNTIKHECHRHPLTLTTSPVKDSEDEDEHAEFYCDVCEEERRLGETTYCCAQCHFVAHIECALSQVRQQIQPGLLLHLHCIPCSVSTFFTRRIAE